MLKEMTKEEKKYVRQFNLEMLLVGLEPRLRKLVTKKIKRAIWKSYDLGRAHEKPGYPNIHVISDDDKNEFKRFFGFEMEKFIGNFNL